MLSTLFLAILGLLLLVGLAAWLLWPLLAISGLCAAVEAGQHRRRADEIDRILAEK